MSEKISLSAGLPKEESPVVVPSEAIAIPSEGKTYPPDHPLHNKEFVMIRPMTARDEDILTSRALFKTGKVIDSLLRSCLLEKVDPATMLVGDRNAVIIGIRVSGYGSTYTTKMECPTCGSKVPLEVDLGNLPMKNIAATPIVPWNNEFEFRTKMSNKTVRFKLPTGADEQELGMIIERMRRSVGTESLVTSRLMQQVISIDGETDRSKLAGIVRNLPAGDSRELRNYMDKVAPDVRLVEKFTCNVCAYEAEEVEVPLGTEFFWPTT